MWLERDWYSVDAGDTEEKDKQLAEIMKICDNLFYGDYYEKGGEYKTKEELEQQIKDSLREDFIEFYGEQYADKINDRIDKHTIVFAYQTIGRNSVEEFLNKKEREYLESKGIDLETAKVLRSASVTLSINGGFDVDQLIENKEGILKDNNIIKALEKLGFESDIFETGNNEKMREFVQKVNELGSARYSDIPEVDSDMRKLSRFVSQYRRDLEQERELQFGLNELGEIQHLEGDDLRLAIIAKVIGEMQGEYPEKSLEEIKKDPDALRRANEYLYLITMTTDDWIKKETKQHDPLRIANTNSNRKVIDFTFGSSHLKEALFDENSKTLASCNSLYSVVSLGISPSDWSVIHEFIHAIEFGGFQRYDKKLSKEDAPYTYHLGQHQMIDEVCVDYFAKLIYESRIAKGKGAIVNQIPQVSGYSVLFPIMAPFIERMLPDIKVAKMVEKENPGKGFKRFSNIVKNVLHKADPDPTPASFFGALIGQDNFDQISLLCNKVISLYSPANKRELIKILAEDNKTPRQALEEIEKDLSGLVGAIINEQDMVKLEHEKGKKGIFDLIRSIKELPEVAREAVQERDQTMIEIKQVIDNPELEQGVKDIETPNMESSMPHVAGGVQNAPGVETVPIQGSVSQLVQQNPGYQTPSPSAPTPPVRNDDMVM